MNQKVLLNRIRNENEMLKERLRILKMQVTKTQEAIDRRTRAIEYIDNNPDQFRGNLSYTKVSKRFGFKSRVVQY